MADRPSDTDGMDSCPTCGSVVRVIGSAEGTCHYVPGEPAPGTIAEAERHGAEQAWTRAAKWLAAQNFPYDYQTTVAAPDELLRPLAKAYVERDGGDVEDWEATMFIEQAWAERLPVTESPSSAGVHTCHAGCPCRTGGEPLSDFEEANDGD